MTLQKIFASHAPRVHSKYAQLKLVAYCIHKLAYFKKSQMA